LQEKYVLNTAIPRMSHYLKTSDAQV